MTPIELCSNLIKLDGEDGSIVRGWSLLGPVQFERGNQCCAKSKRRFWPSLTLGGIGRGNNGHWAPFDDACSYRLAILIDAHIHRPQPEGCLRTSRTAAD